MERQTAAQHAVADIRERQHDATCAKRAVAPVMFEAPEAATIMIGNVAATVTAMSIVRLKFTRGGKGDVPVESKVDRRVGWRHPREQWVQVAMRE